MAMEPGQFYISERKESGSKAGGLAPGDDPAAGHVLAVDQDDSTGARKLGEEVVGDCALGCEDDLRDLGVLDDSAIVARRLERFRADHALSKFLFLRLDKNICQA